MLPQLAEGDANKVFVVPSEFAQAFGGIGEALARRVADDSSPRPGNAQRPDSAQLADNSPRPSPRPPGETS